MPKPLPPELRSRVVAAFMAGEGSFPELAKGFTVGVSGSRQRVKRQGDVEIRQGALEDGPRGGGQVVSGKRGRDGRMGHGLLRLGAGDRSDPENDSGAAARCHSSSPERRTTSCAPSRSQCASKVSPP